MSKLWFSPLLVLLASLSTASDDELLDELRHLYAASDWAALEEYGDRLRAAAKTSARCKAAYTQIRPRVTSWHPQPDDQAGLRQFRVDAEGLDLPDSASWALNQLARLPEVDAADPVFEELGKLPGAFYTHNTHLHLAARFFARREEPAVQAHLDAALVSIEVFAKRKGIDPRLIKEARAQALVLQASSALRRGNLPRARHLLDLAHFQADLSLVHIGWARLAFAEGNESNLGYALDSLRALEEYKTDPVLAAQVLALEAWYLASASREDPNRLDDAIEACEKALTQPLLPRAERRNTEYYLGLAYTRAKRADAAQRMLSRALENGTDDVRIAVLRTKIAQLKGDPISVEELLATFDGFHSEWMVSPRGKQGAGFLHFVNRRAFLSEVLDALPSSKAALQQLVRAQELGTSVLSLGSDLSKGTADECAARVQQLVPAGGGILVILPAPTRSHLFVIDSSGIDHVRLAPMGSLSTLALGFIEPIRGLPRANTPAEEFPWEQGKALREALLPDEVLRRVRTWASVRCIGFDQLGELPVELLPVGGTGLLGSVIPVSRVPSLPYVQLLQAREVAERPSVTILASPETSGDLDKRYSLEALPDRIGDRPLGGFPGLILIGPDATGATFLKATAQNGIVEVIAHGILDYERVHTTGIALAGAEGAVFLDHVSQCHADLVVLFSCGIASGETLGGDDVGLDLVRGLLSQGATTVVAAPRDLEFASACKLLRAINEALAEGKSADEAVRRAREALLADPVHGHPSFGRIEVHGLGELRWSD